MTFYDNGTAFCTAGLSEPGLATCDWTPASNGNHTLKAVYSGDANYKTSTSPTITVAVTMAPT